MKPQNIVNCIDFPWTEISRFSYLVPGLHIDLTTLLIQEELHASRSQ